MRLLALAFTLLTAISCVTVQHIPSIAIQEAVQPAVTHQDMISTVVKLGVFRNDTSMGSGSAVLVADMTGHKEFSYSQNDSEPYTYVLLTAAHVVMGIDLDTDSIYLAMAKLSSTGSYESTYIKDTDGNASVHIFMNANDSAWIVWTSDTPLPVRVAAIASTDYMEELPVGSTVYNVGCGVGLPPMVSTGNLSMKNFPLYDMGELMIVHLSSVVTEMGCSGGAVYSKDGLLIGIISMKTPARTIFIPIDAFYYFMEKTEEFPDLLETQGKRLITL